MTFTAEQLLDDTRLDAGFRRELAATWSASTDVPEEVWRPRLDEWGVTRPGSPEGLADLVAVGNSWKSALDDRKALADSAGRFDAAVDEILDLGACGLEFFEKFLPIARTLGYTRPDEDLSSWYHRRYDWERGMDLRALSGDVDRLERAMRAATAEFEGQRRAANTVRSAWTDDVGATAAERVGAQLGVQDSNLEQLDHLAEALAEVVRTLSTAVNAKALAVAALYAPTVQGYTPERIGQLARIVQLASTGAVGLLGGAIDAASTWFPMLAGASSVPAEEAVGRVQLWLAVNFRPEYERRREEFDAACASCREAVEEAYRIGAEVARGVVPSAGDPPPLVPASTPVTAPAFAAPVPAPGAPSAPAEVPSAAALSAAGAGASGGAGSSGGVSAPAAPSSPAPSQSPPSSQSPTPSPPGGTTPFLAPIEHGTAPAPGSHPGFGSLSGLGAPMDSAGRPGLGSVLGQIGSVVEPLIEGVRSAIEDVVAVDPEERGSDTEDGDPEDRDPEDRDPEDRDTDGGDTDGGDNEAGPRDSDSGEDAAPSGPELVVELDGQKWTLATDADGSVLTMTSENGEVTRFGVGLGPDGQPQIVPADTSVPQPDPAPAAAEPGAEDGPPAAVTPDVPVSGDTVPGAVPAPGAQAGGSPPVVPAPAATSDPQGSSDGGAGDGSGAALAEAGPL
ncbi:hypothetical protein G4H71_16945 [Rhodococcus triatomae]|uniref:Uncharacterized protein n=1 Tax=Rhodococcus triatomae TaxID=300028 RepID=A0A1G8R7K0_9NOCA|nr:hypothetical protein [Rhodococcus triatomae]QNG19584.1 hypothetical protein G4H72_13430 [Rhodococcus triatomae]QNG24501.1 hypothetical protein G4H71_16945 [Rhodococcus triatomae]SDJ12370.1 hypothetical protein SAMN05444695_11716 [Rhodococcus triatomae]